MTKCSKYTWWVLLFCNATSGIIYGYSLIPFYHHTLLHRGEPFSTAFTAYRISSTLWVRICSIISGVILLRAVNAIQNFFLDRDAENFIDLGMLRRHSIAFKLYLFGSTCTALSLVLVNIFSARKPRRLWYDIFSGCFMADMWMEFVSQCFVCKIFYTLGKKVE